MGTRHLYWILTGPSFAVRDLPAGLEWTESKMIEIFILNLKRSSKFQAASSKNYSRPQALDDSLY
jgi:hypothetical protein